MRAALAVGLLTAALAAPALAAPPVEEDFFIVSSVDAGKSSVVLKRPTEVTLTMRFTDKTVCRTEQGKSCRPADLRAGDTVYVASRLESNGEALATAIRHGVMTVPELKRRYLSPK
jgi:hypothetical protein